MRSRAELLPSTIHDLPTPCALVDRARLERNVAWMRDRMRALGVALRPHVKTAKCVEIARMCCEGHPGGITVSTLAEAEHFAAGGFRDMVYAVGISPAKLGRVHRLQRAGVEISVLLDDPSAARAVAAEGRRLATRFPVLIELDTDGHRAGLAPEGDELLDLARTLEREDGAELRGVLTHAGQSYHCATTGAIRAMAERERAGAVAAAERLRAAGLDCPVVSVGSTPTARFAERLSGVTEARPGNYVFFDLFQANLGVCRIEDVALSVLATVIGHDRHGGRFFTDAGGLALSKDRSTADQPVDQRYGLVCEASAGEVIPGVVVSDVYQEHGVVEAREGTIDLSRFPIGSRVRVLPNHSCMTAAAHARYHVVDHEGNVTATWARCNGW